ncbi:dihydrolipoamide acetyltransferase family protein [soil metagenome]
MSGFELKMPKLGESVTEGTIGKWLKQPGEQVSKYDLVVEVQTDKVNTEIPSPGEGTTTEIKVQEGETVPVGALLAVMDLAEASGTAAGSGAGAADGGSAAAEAPAPPPAASPAQTVQAEAPAAGSSNGSRGDGAGALSRPDVRATPAVRKLAAEHSIDLSSVPGTGLGGRVSRQDVERYVASRDAAPTESEPPAGAPLQVRAAPQREAEAGDEVIPLSQMRKAIANAMVLSKTTIPHAAAMVEVDWTNVAKLRASAKGEFAAREGFELTFLPFAIKAVCEALRKNALVNAAWTDKGVLKLKAINLGIAIGLEDEGLVVPVIKNADELSITGIARAVRDLASRARSKKLTLADFEGGTFTVNNGGTYGTYLSYPIVNPPHAAIMTTEAITKRVVVLEDDVIAIRSMGNMVLSFDHRVMDGATAARFLRDVKLWIQGVNASVPIS